jgi:hypothetical protein
MTFSSCLSKRRRKVAEERSRDKYNNGDYALPMLEISQMPYKGSAPSVFMKNSFQHLHVLVQPCTTLKRQKVASATSYV